MNILFINGSPNKNGNTKALAEKMLKEKAYETLNLTDYRIGSYGQNFQDDQLDEVIDKMKAADVIVVDYNPLTPMNESNLNGHLLFGINGSMVRTTICNGKVLMKDREVLVCDVDKVMADCRQSAQELADDINGGK